MFENTTFKYKYMSVLVFRFKINLFMRFLWFLVSFQKDTYIILK